MSSAAPLNFIPGATKPLIQRSPDTKPKRETNARYRSIPLRYSSKATENEKAVVSVGLAALALLAPPISDDDVSQENIIDLATHSVRSRSMNHLHCHSSSNSTNSTDINGNNNADRETKKFLPAKYAKKVKKEMGSKRWRSLERLHNYTL